MANIIDLYAFMQFTAISLSCSSVPVSIIENVKVCPAVLHTGTGVPSCEIRILFMCVCHSGGLRLSAHLAKMSLFKSFTSDGEGKR